MNSTAQKAHLEIASYSSSRSTIKSKRAAQDILYIARMIPVSVLLVLTGSS
jgi:hypothetical protein